MAIFVPSNIRAVMSITSVLRMLGPGLLYAGAAVGVSHLVQSTRAGADFGFTLAGIILLVNAVKYPFFEFGPRYATATGEDLIQGYARLGKWALILFGLLTVSTMFAVQAAVTSVTAGIVAYVFNVPLSQQWVFVIVILLTMLFLFSDRYQVLDYLIKVVILLLTLSTILAVVLGFSRGYHPDPAMTDPFDWVNPLHLAFLIAFIGWMPAPIDVSVWHSLWSVSKQQSVRHRISLRQSLADFRTGYIGTALLALGFLSLGALVMHGSGVGLDPRGAVFSEQLIGMYTGSLGAWAFPVIAAAALTTMVSTTLTCLDAYPRVLGPLGRSLFGRISPLSKRSVYRLWMLLMVAGSIILFSFLASSMRFMVDLATTLSFVTAPLLGWLNHRVVHSRHMPPEGRPPRWLTIYSLIGLVMLTGFTLFYISWTVL